MILLREILGSTIGFYDTAPFLIKEQKNVIKPPMTVATCESVMSRSAANMQQVNFELK